jgi:hypothetical protein
MTTIQRTKPQMTTFQMTTPQMTTSVAEPHHFYAAPAPDLAPGKIFDAAPDPAAPAPAPTLLYSKEKFFETNPSLNSC